jgi:hypothetical protein
MRLSHRHTRCKAESHVLSAQESKSTSIACELEHALILSTINVLQISVWLACLAEGVAGPAKVGIPEDMGYSFGRTTAHVGTRISVR